MECTYKGLCGDEPCEGAVELRTAMTQYHWDGPESGKPDPNASFLACESHWVDYHDKWKAQWDEYYGIIYEGLWHV